MKVFLKDEENDYREISATNKSVLDFRGNKDNNGGIHKKKKGIMPKKKGKKSKKTKRQSG